MQIFIIFPSMVPCFCQLSEQEDLIVWMRAAALPSFRKLYGRILEDLNADDLLDVRLANNYNTYNFGGKKKLVLSTANWFGGKNDFLGIACISTGSFSILIAVAFALLHVRNPRWVAYIRLFSSVIVKSQRSWHSIKRQRSWR